ncbi:MAG: hypothetical protein WCP22_02680 [Chlamydiota bacterium]
MNRYVRYGIRARLGVALCALIGSLVFAELLFRFLLTTDCSLVRRVRKPDLYASYFGDNDYWKLQYLWIKQFLPPAHPHPLLGWTGDFSRDTYLHNRTKELNGRRPVLLYGDSFAQCLQVRCFQDILNEDPAFNAQYFMLNYGVGGYGMDQSYLLLRESIDLYDNPFVIFSMYWENIDRNLLSVRTGQKPYFRMVDGTLCLQGVPINSDSEAFFMDNPPAIPSYLWRLLLYLTTRETAYESPRRREEKKVLASAILTSVIAECRSRNLDLIFIVFYDHWAGPLGWRGSFLKEYFKGRGVPYIWSVDVIRQKADGVPLRDLISPETGHPTARYNSFIAEEIKRHVLLFPRMHENEGDPSNRSQAHRPPVSGQELLGVP